MGDKRTTIEEVKRRIYEVHGSIVTIKDGTYIRMGERATFIVSVFGEWKSIVSSVLRGKGHRKRYEIGKRCTLENVKARIFSIHGIAITIKEETYRKVSENCTFVDIDFGEWECHPSSVLSGSKHPDRSRHEHRSTLESVKSRLLSLYGVSTLIEESTYTMVANKANFIDHEFGVFEATVNDVLMNKVRHPKRRLENSKKTCLERYGVEYVSQVKEISLRAAKRMNRSSIKYHWKNDEELVCQASYEPKVIDYLNELKIDFLWQPQVFILPNGKSYRPDLFLIKENKWIEIKGYMRPHSQLKWDWFKTQFPTAELWDKKKLKEMGVL